MTTPTNGGTSQERLEMIMKLRGNDGWSLDQALDGYPRILFSMPRVFVVYSRFVSFTHCHLLYLKCLRYAMPAIYDMSPSVDADAC